MIFSSIHNDSVSYYPEAIQKAIHYLKEHDFLTMKPGVYEIQGKDIEWRHKLGHIEDDPYNRKRIGDFACYIVFVNCLCRR